MQPTRPDVSIVIPTYNEGDWLRRTVQSILDAKTKLAYEIVVVDDCCDDGSVESVKDLPGVSIVPTGAPQTGCIVARNLGGSAARGEHLCFLDSHVLVHDNWLDYLRRSCEQHPRECIVTGNIRNADNPQDRDFVVRSHFGYTFKNWQLHSTWHWYGRNYAIEPYHAPLSPGGLMFLRSAYFQTLGGFGPYLRKWGREDAEISLRNFCMGGDNIVDPHVLIYHRYKKPEDRTFQQSTTDSFFNALFLARTYFPLKYYRTVREALAARVDIAPIEAELEAGKYDAAIVDIRAKFVRGFTDWITKFREPLAKWLNES